MTVARPGRRDFWLSVIVSVKWLRGATGGHGLLAVRHAK
jgi:hypothetical protein